MISEKQILKAEKPGDMFTNDIKIIKNEYKELVKIYHPDVNTSPNAKDIFQKINNFYNIALKDIEEKRWEKKNFIRINKTNGKAIEATYLSSIKFELGETYVCNKHIIYVFDSDKKKYKDNMISSIKAIKYENKKMEEEFKRYFPTILDEFTTTEGKHVVVISKTEDVFPLKDVLNYFNNKIENRHVAWIISRLQNICCFLKYNNIVHNGININNCFISPEHHAILLLGGWWYATKTDEKMIGTTKEIFDIMPILSKSNKKSSPITDLESIKLLGRTLCGYSNPRTFMKETDIPKPIAEFLIGGSGDDAYKEFQTWDTVLDKGYGVRKFIPLTVTQKQIYSKGDMIMGYGSWKSSSWDSYTSSRGYTSTSTAKDMYKSSTVKKEFEPKGVEYRESCDSTEHPNSTPIILALDVTGSMGRVLETISLKLNTLLTEIYEKNPVEDPQVMFVAFGDTTCDRHPLQVTQFESDIRIAEQLNDIYFERGGGGNDGESYILPWYFASRHTKTDAFEKHNKKGILFTMGDEPYLNKISKGDIKEFVGDDIQADLTAEQLLTEVSRQYEVYHLMIEEGSGMRGSYGDEVKEKWTNLLGQRAIPVSDCTKIPEIIVSILEVMNGKDKTEIIDSWDGSTGIVVRKAIKNLSEVKAGSSLVEF